MKKPKKVKSFTIKRGSWLRGKRTTAGSVLRIKRPGNHVMRCCLGFYLEACGVPIEELNNRPTPRSLGDTLFGVGADWLIDGNNNSSIAKLLMEFNDDQYRSPAYIEKKVRELFKMQGITVRFEGRK